MSVEIYSGDQSLISATPAALDHIRSHLSANQSKVLRISTAEAGCSGYMYELDFASVPEADDQVCQLADDVVLYIAQAALTLLRGTKIDYVTEGLNASMKFDNPNAEAWCGCGESFTVKQDNAS